MQHCYLGDVVLADRGFTCDDYARTMAMMEAKTPLLQRERKEAAGESSCLEPRIVCSSNTCTEGDRFSLKQKYTTIINQTNCC